MFFDNSYDDIEDGYIEYLEFLYAHIDSNIPQLTTNKAIYIEQGSSVIINSDNLSATDQEVTDDKLYYKN